MSSSLFLILKILLIRFFFQLLAERAIKDADMQTTRLQKLQQEYDNQLINYDQLSSDQQSRLTELKVCQVMTRKFKQ